MCKIDFNLLVYCFVILGIEKNLIIYYQSLVQSVNVSVNLKNYGEIFLDVISIILEGV